MIHKPVLTKEVMKALRPLPGEFMIDATLGGGGHASQILEKLGNGTFLAIDLDKTAITQFESKTNKTDARIIAVNDNFVNLPKILESENLGKADGLLMDLGLSSDEIEASGRGFTFKKDEPLLMTLDDSQTPVREILRALSEEELANVIYELGDERFSRHIAKEIKMTLRKGERIETTFALRDAIYRAVPKSYEKGRIDPSTRTFLALRIYVNHELDNLKSVLRNLDSILKPGGRLVVITFHSGEDRVVKNIFRDMSKLGEATLINKKAIGAERDEILENPRSRSAKLRAIVWQGGSGSRSEKFRLVGVKNLESAMVNFRKRI